MVPYLLFPRRQARTSSMMLVVTKNVSSYVVVLLAVVSTVGAFTTPRPAGRTTTTLNVGVDDVLPLVQSGSESLLNIVTTAESPANVWTQLPIAAKGAAVVALGMPIATPLVTVAKSIQQIVAKDKKAQLEDENLGYRSYPEGKPASYEMNPNVVPFEFGDAAFVRPLLKQTQLETRPLQLVYDANRDGYDARTFHSKVDGKGASVVLIKVAGQWCGGYNPRGWASLGQARSSVAAFLFYQKSAFTGGWQKIRVSRTGSMACGNDLYDDGIYFGADSLILPLRQPNVRKVTSRLGQYFEARPDGKYTLLPRAGEDFNVQELKVLSGVYAPGEGTCKLASIAESPPFSPLMSNMCMFPPLQIFPTREACWSSGITKSRPRTNHEDQRVRFFLCSIINALGCINTSRCFTILGLWLP